jgi:hypothetical protein
VEAQRQAKLAEQAAEEARLAQIETENAMEKYLECQSQ